MTMVIEQFVSARRKVSFKLKDYQGSLSPQSIQPPEIEAYPYREFSWNYIIQGHTVRVNSVIDDMAYFRSTTIQSEHSFRALWLLFFR
ncbi:hypothetical protein PM082_013613 [Marasmius tenuissimus]|nr:hypothetical protein PM082_013613 [Marasmius tenuissimus]